MKQLKLKQKFNIAYLNLKIYRLNNQAKILKYMPKNNGLTDEDILNLFVGLMNLVKNSATEKAENFYRTKLNKYVYEINKKTKELIKLETELTKLKQK